MGKFARKTPYKKLLKQEKAKTKLKVSHKTILPKGQNIVNTSFKIRKIVVKSQLKEHVGEQIVSKNNLNVKELISRLHHHNAPLRINSLSSLSELVNIHGESILNSNLPALLHAASNLILDKEQEVRSEAIKLLSVILVKATELQLVALFEIIINYLACAMTHIDVNIRGSSLIMLDILICKRPRLTAEHCQPVILPAFLDLISTKFSDSERKLTLQYSDKMTTNIWRIKVLVRLQALLSAMVDIQSNQKSGINKQECVKKIKWCDNEPVYASLYSRPYNIRKFLYTVDVQSRNSQKYADNIYEIKTYTEMLLPLLLHIFVEVSPHRNKKQNLGQHLSNDAVILLKLISDIILLLWQIFDLSDSSSYLKCWFTASFANSIREHLIIDKFPYSLSDHRQEEIQMKNKKNKSRTKTSLPATFSDCSNFLTDKRCIVLNTNLCHIYFLFTQYSADIYEFKNMIRHITDTLEICQELERDTITKLLNCIDAVFSCLSTSLQSQKSDILRLIKIIKRLYDETSTKDNFQSAYVSEKTFDYLYKIVLDKSYIASNDPDIVQWLNNLPSLLTVKKVSFQTVKKIANIARCNLIAFTNSLDNCINMILDNLPTLEIMSDRKLDRVEGKKLTANLLYFVRKWDDEFVNGLTKALRNNYFANLNNHIKDIVETKIEENFQKK